MADPLPVRRLIDRCAAALDAKLRRLFGRSLRLRQVSAGGCNACEADTNVLGTIGWDLSRFGIQFVASPRHADGLLITGPVTEGRLTSGPEHAAPATPWPPPDFPGLSFSAAAAMLRASR